MSYKGGDLDLRTPLGLTSPAAATGAAPAASAGGKLPPSALARTDRSASIWVDETVMACCNRAFELASAHRADLVRTEHLLHALVLVERTTDALQRLGVDADALRRETGALIAADLPALPNTDSTPPGRSNEFEQILQVAGQRAYALRRPISAADLIASLLEGPANGPGVKILQRHRRDVASLASSSRRERVRVQAVSQHTGQQDTGQPARAGAARSGGRTPESAATAPAESEANRPPGADSASTQERANADPNALPPKGAVVVLEPTAASRGQGPYEVVVRTENLRAVEALENKFSNIEQALSSVLERITGFERDLRGKLDEDSSRFDAIAAHLTAFEAALTEPDDAKSNDALVPHLTAIAVQNGEMSGAIDVVRSRLTVIETATEAQNAGNERLQAVMASLSVSLAAERKAIVRAVTEPVERRLAAVEASLQEQHIEGRDGLREIGGRLRPASGSSSGT